MKVIVLRPIKISGESVAVGAVLEVSDMQAQELASYGKVAAYTGPVAETNEPQAVEVLHVEPQPEAAPITVATEPVAPRKRKK